MRRSQQFDQISSIVALDLRSPNRWMSLDGMKSANPLVWRKRSVHQGIPTCRSRWESNISIGTEASHELGIELVGGIHGVAGWGTIRTPSGHKFALKIPTGTRGNPYIIHSSLESFL